MSALPHLFVLGDSISIAYGPVLERMLAGRFAYDRKGYAELASQDSGSTLVNGGDSRCVLEYLHAHPSLPPPGGILLLNCGLHDVRVDPHSGTHQVELDIYTRNLEQIITLAKTASLRMVWVCTTPVVDALHNRVNQEYFRYNADVMAYNARAARVMQNAGIPSIDLYRFTLNLCIRTDALESLFEDHVHFTQPVSLLQGVYIAGWLEAFQYAW